MKKILLLVTAVICSITPIFAENTSPESDRPLSDANVFGHILDAATGEHIPYVTISIKGTTIGTVADATGHYHIQNIPVGEHTIIAEVIGYASVEQKIVAKKNKSIEVNFSLKEEALDMDMVVISATRNETNKKQSATIVNVAAGKLFENTGSTNLAESMRFQPGLRVENTCGNCGAVQLRINGLEGQYSQVLLDSNPVFSSLSGVYGMELLPVSMIERVEVIRGGGSALFGSNAIGGVVNIITKEPLRNSLNVAHTSSINDKADWEHNTTLGGSFVSSDNRAGVYIFAMAKDRDAYDRNDDGFSDITHVKSETVGFRGYYKLSTQSKLTAEYHHINDFRRGGDVLDLPPHEAEIAEQVKHNINGGSLRYDYFSPNSRHFFNAHVSTQSINRDSYYGAGKDPNAYGKTKDLTLVAGAQYSYVFEKCLFMPAQLTVGFEFTHNDLNDHSLSFDRSIAQEVNTGGIFVQNEWRNEKVNFVIGGRLDKHNMMDDVIFSPRANLRYSPIEEVGLRLSYSSGYRAPQAFDEDLHIDAVNNQSSIITLSPDLKPEYSHSLSGSVDLYHNFGTLQANLLIEGFYTILDDVFALNKIGENEAGYIVQERYNASGAKVKGITTELMLGIPDVFDVQLGYTYQRSRYDEPESWSDNVEAERRMFRTPDHYAYITATGYITDQFKASVFGNYTGEMLVTHNAGWIAEDRNEITPTFWDMGVRLSYNFHLTSTIDLELEAGVKNIFNQFQDDIDFGANRDSVYTYGPLAPRTYFFGVKFKL